MKRAIAFLVLVACGQGAAAPDPGLERARSIGAEVERIAVQTTLWPGFDPLQIPLAVFVGDRTCLFRHPAPPEGFTRVEDGGPPVFVFSGRHPAVTANSSADIGGTMTATLLADGGRAASLTPTHLAAVALHEAFHVYQRSAHATWIGNEGDLFLYPDTVPRLLALRRLESAALGRALAASPGGTASCWARTAMDYRRQRFEAMDPAFPAYERATELNEGLAEYIELRGQRLATIAIPDEEFRPTDVRARIYVIGPAIAMLLDRFGPGWQASLERDDSQTLDTMLTSALKERGEHDAGACGFSGEEIAREDRRAADDVAGLAADRARRKAAFDQRPGWRVTVRAAERQPLWPRGFDPLNVERVDGGVLHGRMLLLGNDAGELRVIDEAEADVEAFTVGAGAHPLFNGVREVVVAGLAEPQMQIDDGHVSLRAPGFTAAFTHATAQVDGTAIVVTLGAAPRTAVPD